MLLYNWNRIFETCKGSPSEIVRVFKMLVDKQLPRNKYDKLYKYSYIDFSCLNINSLLTLKHGTCVLVLTIFGDS